MAPLPDLFPAQVGSPYTKLSAAYTTGESTMSLVDATKLPAAPNIVCLSGAAAGEFSYSGKDGNNLTGVSALSGTPSATWAIGDFAFRGISAYDLNSLQTCVNNNPLNKLDATAAPTVNDDSGDGYSVASLWVDVTNNKSYICQDATEGAAVWTEITVQGTANPMTAENDMIIGGSSGTQTRLTAPTTTRVKKLNSIKKGLRYHPDEGIYWEDIRDIEEFIIGIRWDLDSNSPTLTRVDVNGETFGSVNAAYFNEHPIFGNMWRCTINPTTGDITYGSNARGDGLTLNANATPVMRHDPMTWIRQVYDAGENWLTRWISPVDYTGFKLHPYFNQRGVTGDKFSSAYEAGGYLDTTFRLTSRTGIQPVTGEVSYTDIPSNSFTIANAESYGNNVGSGWGCENIWNWSWQQLMMYIEYSTFNMQSAFSKSRGIVDKDSGSGFAGELCGADSADTNIGTNGTGTGTGTDGYTPVVIRGRENPWGNVYTFLAGVIAVDAEYRLIKADGGTSAIIDTTLGAGTYDISLAAPITSNGYISGIVHNDELLAGLYLPSAVAGSDATYICDYFTAHSAGQTNILMGGGYWNNAGNAGPGFLHADNVASLSHRIIGARLEYAPQ